MLKNWTVLGVVAGAFALALPSNGTVLIEKSLDDLVSESEMIVRATATHRWAQASTTTDNIDTFTEFEVTEWIGGDEPTSVVVVKTPGGELDDRSVEVPGTARFLEGQDVVLFLHGDMTDLTNVVGWAQGAFHIEDGVVRQAGVPLKTFRRRLDAVIENLNF